MTTSFTVQNIKCDGCVQSIYSELKTLANVHDLKVSLEDGQVSFSYEKPSDIDHVKQKLKQIGYPALHDN